jgi:ABC-type antimicrobial peptide transport system permease subunit
MPEVERVTPILYLNNVIVAGDTKMFAFIVGLLPGDERAGPWEMSAGRKLENPGEAIMPDVLSGLTGVGIGDEFHITDKVFTVVGLSKGTFSSANAVLFVPFSDLEDILSSSGTYSYLLIDAKQGVDAQVLAEKIRNEVGKVNALPHEDFVKNDYAMAKQMGVELIIIMTIICSTLAALIVGFTAYSLVMRKRRELAIAKALGFRSHSILYGVIVQSILVTLSGFLIAVLFAVFVIPYTPLLVPQITAMVSAGALAQLGLIALLVATTGALIPAYVVTRLDPATVFHV